MNLVVVVVLQLFLISVPYVVGFAAVKTPSPLDEAVAIYQKKYPAPKGPRERPFYLAIGR